MSFSEIVDNLHHYTTVNKRIQMNLFLQMFHQCQSAIQRMSKQSRSASKQEQRMLKNVTSSLAVSLQDLSTNFRKSQSSYLKSRLLIL